MKRGNIAIYIAIAVGLCLFGRVVSAHPLDVAYFDISQTPTSTWLTVAVHPYQAFELVRAGKKIPFDLRQLAERQDLITAYVSDHVSLRQEKIPCVWSPESAHVPLTELDAVADGVTIAAPVQCQEPVRTLEVGSDIFLDGFPTQSNILRLEFPEGFAEKGKMDAANRRLTVEIPPAASQAGGAGVVQQTLAPTKVSRIADAGMADIARRLLDPGLQVGGFLLVLASAVLIGALHALGPGHGKSLMAAVLVGEDATWKRVVALGTVMTVTHVADVFLLALFAGFIAGFLPPTTLIRYLEALSAAGLFLFGLIRIFQAWKGYRQAIRNPNQAIADDAHARAHQLGLPKSGESFSRALWLGFVGSLAPCPTAWAIFMGTISIGRMGAGLALLVAFTIGLHLTILVIGFLLVVSKKFAASRTPPRVTYFLPIISATCICILGIYLLLRNLAIIQ